MKKAIIAIVAVVIIAGGTYAVLHKPSKDVSSTSNNGSGSAQSEQSPSQNAPAVNNAVLTTKTASSIGQYLADPNGKALYTYSADTKGVSNCTGSCLSAWPAYVDKGSTADLPAGVGTITRKDNGQIQYTYNGLPLYYFVSDGPGQVTGDGVQNFSVARPVATSSSSSSSSTSTSAQSGSRSSSPSYSY